MQRIEHIFVKVGEDVDIGLWERKKYWQAQLFTSTHRLNNMTEWYAEVLENCCYR